MDALALPSILPAFYGERIVLRAMEDDDAMAIHAIYSDPRVMQYTDEAPFPDQATVAVMLASVRRLLAEGTSLEWAIALRDSGEMIGTCGLHSFNGRHAEAGCMLRRSAWGRGYMSEALRLLMNYAGDVLHLRRLIADVAPENTRAQQLFDALGFRRDGSGAGSDVLALDLNPFMQANGAQG